MPTAAPAAERRNVTSRQELLRRVAHEYEEMPTLLLTVAPAQRLFGLREDVSVRVLNTLVHDKVVRRAANGTYFRAWGKRNRG